MVTVPIYTGFPDNMLRVMQGASNTGGTSEGTCWPERSGERQSHTREIDGYELGSNNTVRNASCLSCSEMCGCMFYLQVEIQSSRYILLRNTRTKTKQEERLEVQWLGA